MDKISIGDVVTLKSGGPKMTVTAAVALMPYFICQWFVGTELKSGQFHKDELKKEE